MQTVINGRGVPLTISALEHDSCVGDSMTADTVVV